MAELFKPTFYVNPETGKRVGASVPGAIRKRSKKWHIRYYLPGGKRAKVKGYTDKTATLAKAAELERRAIRADAGIIDTDAIHAKTPLAQHAEDFRRYLAAKGNTAFYVKLTLYRLTAVLDECRFTHVADVQASALIEFLGRLRQGNKAAPGKSTKTANEYLSAAKGFARWLWRDKRTPTDVLAGVSKLPNGDADLRHARQDFSPNELARLLDAARDNPKSIRCLSGIDRHLLYLTACATGFRAGELASMTPASFNLDGETPTARVESSCTKNRRLAVRPLPLDVAKALRGYLAGKPADLPVWPGKWKSRAFLMIQGDLEKARETWLQSIQDGPKREQARQSDSWPTAIGKAATPISMLCGIRSSPWWAKPACRPVSIKTWPAIRPMPLPRGTRIPGFTILPPPCNLCRFPRAANRQSKRSRPREPMVKSWA